VTRGRRGARTAARPPRHVVLLLAGAVLLLTTGCSRPAPHAAPAPSGSGSAGPVTSAPVRTPAAATPTSAEALEALVVPEVPSGLPRMPDGALSPPAGEKSLDDVAAYAADQAAERKVLRDYGFRYGWERFWGTGADPVTSVFVEQFGAPAGAAAFSADLARNDADHYRAVLHEHPADFPDGCRLLTVADPQPDVGLAGPAAFAWCADGVFSVAVTSVAGTADAARAEVAALVRTQLARLSG
jgi:hypothetical protein